MGSRELLLDTHIVIWMAVNPDRIPVALLRCIENAHTRFVSHVTALEIQLKNTKSPEAFPFSLQELEQTMKEYGCTELPITYSDIRVLGEMQFLHSDPFDRLLMAQARNRKLKLVTVDKDILRTFERSRAFSVAAAK